MSDDSPEQTASPPENQAVSLTHETKIGDLTISQLTAIMRSETERAVATHLGRQAGAGAAAHVNSGPPGFVNGGGHANFDPRKLGANLGGLAGVHVNSGPPGFVNGGGHANFTSPHVNSGPPGFVNGGGHANFDPTKGGASRVNPGKLTGVHVNSGPPGFVNGGGHANFDPGSHVNSGPPGFVNGGGHANFDPKMGAQVADPVINVTLASGQRLALPSSGPINMRIGGVHISR